MPKAPAQSWFVVCRTPYPYNGCPFGTISECMLPCQVGRWPLKRRGGERSEDRGKRLAREEVEIELTLLANMGAERGVTAALALFFFSSGGGFFCQPWPTSSFLLSMFSTKHAQIGKHAQSIGNWRASSNLTLLLHRRLPQHLSILPPPHQPRCDLRHRTTSTRSTHTQTHKHGTRGSQSSQSHAAAFEPLQYLDNPSLPQPF